MFGLRYQMKTNDPDNRMMRWVELDKPLRRQLEKWACKPRQVQLAVLYHTPNAFTLTDQMARSYYFFLMKLDVVEGKLTVALEKYINLAAYSLQVEYGDFDPTIHTIDFMQTVPLLPKHICRSAQIQEDLLKRVSAVHERLKGMQPSYAALLYIVDAQQCEGYGEEYFNGKDEDSTEVKIGYSQEGIIIKGSYGAPLKHKWEQIKDMQAMKRHLNVRLHDGTLIQFTMEDVEMARYVAMVMMWQFRYATNKAIIEKNSPMNINNLQGSIRTFNLMRSSNAELNTTRLNGPDYASLVYTMMPEPTYCSSTQRLPSTKRSQRTSLLQATSMYNLSTYTDSNDTQTQPAKRSPLTSLLQYNKAKNGIADILLSNDQTNIEIENVSRNVLSKSTAALNFMNDEECTSPSDVLYCSTPFLLQNNAKDASSPEDNHRNMIPSVAEDDAQKFEFHSFAALGKRHLTDTMTGSSPEIRMIGGGTHTLGRSAAALVHKHSLLANGSQKTSPAHALSSPDLLSTCHSSPDLITSVLDRYRLAVAEAELRAAAVVSQKSSKLQHLNGTIQTGRHWQTVKGCRTYILPSSQSTIVKSQQNMNDESQRKNGDNSKIATHTTRFMMMDGGTKKDFNEQITKDVLRKKLCKKSSPMITTTSSSTSSSSQATFFHHHQHQNHHNHPTTSKIKGQTHPISYLAQAGHIYYPPSSSFMQIHDIYRQQNGKTNNFGSPNETNLGVTHANNAMKLSQAFLTHQRYEIIEEDRTPQTFVRRTHEFRTPITAAAVNDDDGTKALPIQNAPLIVSSSRSISSPDVFNNRTKNSITKQLSASSIDSTQSIAIRSVTALEHFSSGNDSENISSQIMPNESSECTVCDKATNICEADFVQNEELLANREVSSTESVREMSQRFSSRHIMVNSALQHRITNTHGHFTNLIGDQLSINDQLSIPTNDQTLKRLLTKLAADDALDEEFAVIPNKRMSAGVSTSQRPENMKRNRTRSIVPYEDTRIMLHSKQSNPTGYINASNIQIPIGNRILKYILAQAPLPDTIEDFWQMIWESGSQLIVMLCSAQDCKGTTTPIYWPTKVMSKLRLSDHSVTLLSSTSSKHQVTMMFQLKQNSNGERRTIYHLRLMDWESGGIPPSEESFLGFMDAVNSVRRHLENEKLKEVDFGAISGSKNNRNNCHINLTHSTNRNTTQSTDLGYYNWCKKGLHVVNYALHHSPSSYSNALSSAFSSSRRNDVMVDAVVPPTVIHCLTGAHESGVYLLVELMIHCIEHNMYVDISKTLALLRQQRMCLVKNVEQYRFVYSALIIYLQKSRLI